MTGLPEKFKEKMENLLGEDYEAFIESYEKERVQGLRINLLKITSYVETSYVKQSTEKTHYFLSVIKL